MTEIAVERHTREEWLEIGGSTDLSKRAPMINALKGYGLKATEYMGMKLEDRVNFIMERQAASEVSEPKAAKKGANGKGKAAASTETATTAATTNGGGGAAAALQKELVALRTEIASLRGLVMDTHYLVRVLVLGNPEAASNSAEPDVVEAFYGKPAVSAPGN